MALLPDLSDAQARRELDRYKMALEVSEDGIWEYPSIDPTQPMDPSIPAYFSPRFYEMLGYTADEFPQVAGSWWNIIHPDDMELSVRVIAAHLADPTRPMFVQYRVRNRQGAYRWWEIRGNTMPDTVPGRIRAIGVVRDITHDDFGHLMIGLSHDNQRFTTYLPSSATGTIP